MAFFPERCCCPPRPRLRVWPAGLGWVGAVGFSPLPWSRPGVNGTSYCNYPRPPRTARAASDRAPGLRSAGMSPTPLTRPSGVRQVVVGRSPGKLPQFPAAQAQHPGYRRLLQRSVEGAAPRARARTRACAGVWAAVNNREVTSRRSRARVFCSRGHSDQARGRHFPANSPALQLSACATRW